MEQFKKDILGLTPVKINSVQYAIDTNQEMTVFIGRATCPYCRKFATKLANVIAKTHENVYFVNSEEESELANLAAFREKYTIPTVPGFLHTKDGQVQVKCDSSMTEEEIHAFMHN